MTLGAYHDNPPPNPHQISEANHYFTRKLATHLISSHRASMLPASSALPEIVLVGRSNVGKSTLVNALLNVSRKPLARVGRKAGHTKCLHLYGIGNVSGGFRVAVKPGMSAELLRKRRRTTTTTTEREEGGRRKELWLAGEGIVLVDTPGYGENSRASWGEMMEALFERRHQ
jgi:GTP-binding protein EngB required for normal cell division